MRLVTLIASVAMVATLATPSAFARKKPPPAKRPAPAAKRPVPSGPLKAYRGPEGELIVMVEVNDSKQMLVYFKNLGGPLEGKSALYLFEDHGRGSKEVFFNRKRGSKTYRHIVLDASDNKWRFFYPDRFKTQFAITYSLKDSQQLKINDVLSAYQP